MFINEIGAIAAKLANVENARESESERLKRQVDREMAVKYAAVQRELEDSVIVHNKLQVEAFARWLEDTRYERAFAGVVTTNRGYGTKGWGWVRFARPTSKKDITSLRLRFKNYTSNADRYLVNTRQRRYMPDLPRIPVVVSTRHPWTYHDKSKRKVDRTGSWQRRNYMVDFFSVDPVGVLRPADLRALERDPAPILEASRPAKLVVSPQGDKAWLPRGQSVGWRGPTMYAREEGPAMVTAAGRWGDGIGHGHGDSKLHYAKCGDWLFGHKIMDGGIPGFNV